jgi:hypothetical protein
MTKYDRWKDWRILRLKKILILYIILNKKIIKRTKTKFEGKTNW